VKSLNILDHPICFTYPSWLAMSGWTGHIPFAMFLIDVLRPKVFVELGTHYGVSYCAFCQAVKELESETTCYAIDNWVGDAHSGFYGPEVLAQLREHHDPLYGGFSRLVQSTFDEAVKHFPDESVDLLHIDGYHTYEVVKHDFETWLPKLSKSGIVLFHDINVRESDFGVWKFWDEIKTMYPSFEFTHSHGLGLLKIGQHSSRSFQDFSSASKQDPVRIKEFFYQLGSRLETAQELQRLRSEFAQANDQTKTEHAQQLDTKDQLVESVRSELRQQAESITDARAQLSEQQKQLGKQAEELARGRKQLTIYETQLQQQSEELSRGRDQLTVYEGQLREKTAELTQIGEQVSHARAEKSAYESQLRQAEVTQKELLRKHTEQAEEIHKAWALKAGYELQLRQTEALVAKIQTRLQRKAEALDWIRLSRTWQLAYSWRRLAQQTLERLHFGPRPKFLGFIDGVEKVSGDDHSLNIWGWAYSTQAPITRVEAFLDDEYIGQLSYGSERPDVFDSYPSVAMANCGYADNLPVDSPFTDQRILTIRAFDARGNKHLYKRIIEPEITASNAVITDASNVVIETRVLPPPLTIKSSDAPVLSVVIPVFNHSSFTYDCLKSIKESLDQNPLKLEVIVVDDNSSDNTQEVMAQVDGVRVLANEENLGFIGACNRGASEARGEYLLFLNNDVLVDPHCFAELLTTFKLHPDAGLVGAKLLYPDGSLQEAGGIIWNDASGWNYGRLDDAEKPEYCYLREVDYCSGACLMIPRSLFCQLNGFDTRYSPAYCEDSDLAFRVKEAGFGVYFQPLAKVVHFEGVTSGKDTSEGVKSHQVINQKKLLIKWKRVLESHGEPGANPHLAKERKVRKRILVIDACVLTPDQDAGSLTVFNHIKIFRSLGYKVTFAPDNLHRDEKYTSDLQRMGVECLYWPYTPSLVSHLEAYGSHYDVVFIARAGVAHAHIDNIKTHCPQAKIIFDTEDLHFVREQRRAELENDPALAELALQRKEQELAVAAKSDCTLVVSHYEKEVLLQEDPRLNVTVIPIPRDILGGQVSNFGTRENILFIGGFQHPPNVDAVLYFVREIFPLVKKQLPDIRFYIIGSKAPAEVLELAADPSIIVTGYVDDLTSYFNKCRLSVAPLRYGAGVKGKVITSLSYGLPVVASGVACEGMQLVNGLEVLIADEPSEFASSVVRLYTDDSLWNKLSANGLNNVAKNYSFAATRKVFEDLFASLNHSARQSSVSVATSAISAAQA
jgi:GT2 family glycosyltransferase